MAANIPPAPIFPGPDPRLPLQRIDHPQSWGAVQPNMAWHHIIPYLLLREVWNRLVDQHIKTEHPKARPAIHDYLLLLNPKLNNDVDLLLDKMRAERNKKKTEAVRAKDKRKTIPLKLAPLTRWDRDELHEAAAWPVWNAVEGPRPDLRCDDPGGDGFEYFKGGLNQDEVRRMIAIEILFIQLRVFRDSKENQGLHALICAIRNAAPFISRCTTPIPYRQAMWVYCDDKQRWKRA
jgi:hypothetical protein